ncbi:N-6 DNA methylase [Paraclostridium bifermentans]|uniref:N-6 DNA methylase n=1 Tax=Paraclostridium bifermentans TaxID=1490 RepID=UPI002852B530|nr:N-6 DNA methylase [Paraclostridium bifermentans]
MSVASIDEIKANDYNLNIPRYVDTFEEEEPIDIVAVSERIKAIDIEIADIDKELRVYLEELGL